VPAAAPAPLYGGQAVVEGVMMRGANHWAVAVRRPDGELHVESHEIRSIARRLPILGKPFLRGIIVLGQSLAIGMRALLISANRSVDDEEQLSPAQVGISLAIAMVLFVGIFILGPTAVFAWIGDRVSGGVWVHIGEGLFRVAIFVGYLALIGLSKDVRRVFEYHGAEHKTIAAHEHQSPLEPPAIDPFPKEHVRCGTNFLIIVLIVTIFVFALFGTPSIGWRIGSRLIAIPLIAGLAYEALRLGARFPRSGLMRGLMRPGIWLQKITTREPDRPQIEVAVASFQEVLRRETEAPSLPEVVAQEGPLSEDGLRNEGAAG
jgi:uncharacterized protein YqhQ